MRLPDLPGWAACERLGGREKDVRREWLESLAGRALSDGECGAYETTLRKAARSVMTPLVIDVRRDGRFRLSRRSYSVPQGRWRITTRFDHRTLSISATRSHNW